MEQQAREFTEAERAALTSRACRGLMWAVLAQAVMAGVAVLLSAVFAGKWAALSALAGALAYLIPNALYAARLMFHVAQRRTGPGVLLVGEMLKLVAVGLLLWILARVAGEWLVWPALLLGLLLTLKGYLLLVPFRKKMGLDLS
ncbi:ABC transporter permease [Alcaligenaceae bacterium SJ-26]|nr:ABC transporter permease [Alcaligenaceae bacterium SJ-26]